MLASSVTASFQSAWSCQFNLTTTSAGSPTAVGAGGAAAIGASAAGGVAASGVVGIAVICADGTTASAAGWLVSTAAGCPVGLAAGTAGLAVNARRRLIAPTSKSATRSAPTKPYMPSRWVSLGQLFAAVASGATGAAGWLGGVMLVETGSGWRRGAGAMCAVVVETTRLKEDILEKASAETALLPPYCNQRIGKCQLLRAWKGVPEEGQRRVSCSAGRMCYTTAEI